MKNSRNLSKFVLQGCFVMENRVKIELSHQLSHTTFHDNRLNATIDDFPAYRCFSAPGFWGSSDCKRPPVRRLAARCGQSGTGQVDLDPFRADAQ